MGDNQKIPGTSNLFVAHEEPVPSPREIMLDFFSWYTPEEAREELLDLFLAAINSEEANNWDASTRGKMIFLYRQLGRLIGAAYRESILIPQVAEPLK